MERLTHRDSQGWYIDDQSVAFDQKRRGHEIDVLAAYENTEMRPDEIFEVQELLKPIEWKRYRGIMEAERSEKLIVLPCKIGDTIYRIIDDCGLAGDCGTKRMCKGCLYRNIFIEEDLFCISLLENDGKLRSGYFLTKEEAEAALSEEDEK